MSDAVIRLDGRRSSYVIDTSGPGIPLCRYWGRRLPDDGIDAAQLAGMLDRPLPLAGLDRDVPNSLLPEFGFGWFGLAGLMGSRGRRDWATAFAFVEAEETADGLALRCRDPVAGLELVLEIGLDVETDVLYRRTRVTNTGAGDYRVDHCAAGAFALPFQTDELLGFEGQWAQEFRQRRQRLGVGRWCRENRRGRTSHDSAPQLIVGTAGFSDTSGEVYGFHLGWSGNHRLEVETLVDGSRQVQLGEWLAPAEVVLAPGETYASPPVYAAYSAAGLNPLTASFHGYVRRQILRWPDGGMRPRPVHFNTWEALYFRHDPQSLEQLARIAADLGVERFVVDDGWFKGRDHDRAALGDWLPDPAKYPAGLGPLAALVDDLGMEFGLWLEPEMVNPDSDLYRAHPDWVLQIDARAAITGRNQLVLDLRREEVTTYLFDAIDKLLGEHAIGYLKWDMNRDLAAAGGEAHGGAAAYREQTLALYALLERIRAAHPRVEIESCASGGARADYGVLRYTHRIWTSDNNDALERQSIQQGFLRFFPPEIMGAHIGPSPAHIGQRRHGLAFRAATALFGHLGLELDLRRLDADERDEIRRWIEAYKEFRDLLHGGTLHQLGANKEAGRDGYGVVAPARDTALFAVVQMTTCNLRVPPPLRLAGIDAAANYRLSIVATPPPRVRFNTPGLEALADGDLRAPGSLLLEAGLQLPLLPPESALILRLDRV